MIQRCSLLVPCWVFLMSCATSDPVQVSEDSAAITAELSRADTAAHATPAPRSGPPYPCVDGAACGSSSVTCIAVHACGGHVDQDCAAGQRGYAVCDGVRVYCPECPCTDGTERFRSTDMCCCPYDSPNTPVGLNAQAIDLCVNGEWVYQGTSCDELTCYGSCGIQ